MQKWEYLTSPAIGTDLTKMGAEGWELVAVDGPNMFFKRPVSPSHAESLHDRLVAIEGHLKAMMERPTPNLPPSQDHPPLPIETPFVYDPLHHPSASEEPSAPVSPEPEPSKEPEHA